VQTFVKQVFIGLLRSLIFGATGGASEKVL